MGIMYSSIFPEPVHSLPNGLTINKLKVKSHDGKYNAVIGGPHQSFSLMSQEFGSFGILFANLTEQLATYQEFGPPKINKNLMTKEDIYFANKFNELGIEDMDVNVIKEFKNKLDDNVDDYHEMLECSGCGQTLSRDSAASLDVVINSAGNDNEEDTAVKNLQKAVNEGLNIDYRCPRCRNCTDCRRSFETERVSLREEAEEMLIWDSVSIDWENKQIVCHLPLRGKEEEFLSDNREMALKVLDQQCFKYKDDEETKASIVKAFEKLLKNKQMILFKDSRRKEVSGVKSS